MKRNGIILNIIFIIISSKCYSIETMKSKPVSDEQKFQFRIKVKDIPSNTESYRNLTLDFQTMEALNLTKQEIESGYIEKNKAGEEFVTEKGIRIEMETNIKEIKKETQIVISFDIDAIQNRTFKDLLKDPAMLPQSQPILSFENRCSYLQLQISITSTKVEGKLNSKSIFEYTSQVFETQDEESKDGGLLLTTVNTRNCKSTFHGLYRTNQYGSFRQLNWALDEIQPKSLVILSSLNDGSLLLNQTSRTKLSKLGSFWSHLYSSEDSWVYVFIHKGPSLVEAISPAILPLKKIAASLQIDILLPGKCTKWPSLERWNARRIFCDTYNDFNTLCDCEKPLIIPEAEDGQMKDWNKIPIGISTSINRSKYMFRILETLGKSPGVTIDLILLSMDEYDVTTAMIAFILGIKTIYRRTVGSIVSKISQAAKFTLFNQLQIYPWSKAFIFLDDDVILANDFYLLMQKMSPLFDLDKTIWCVSGFNFFAYKHTSFDSNKLYRGMKYPLWGWMMPRYILEEILPKWLPPEMDVDWDLYILREEISKGRECVVPEVLRSLHGPSNGAHVQNTIHSEKHLYQRDLNTKITNWANEFLNKLTKIPYVQEKIQEINASSPILIKNINEFIPPRQQSGSYSIYLNKTSPHYRIASRIIQRKFDVWDIDANMDMIEFKYYKAKIFIIAFPSIESLTLPKGYAFYTPSDAEIEEFEEESSPPKNIYKLKNFHVLDLEKTV